MDFKEEVCLEWSCTGFHKHNAIWSYLFLAILYLFKADELGYWTTSQAFEWQYPV